MPERSEREYRMTIKDWFKKFIGTRIIGENPSKWSLFPKRPTERQYMFIKKHATNKYTLDIGCGKRPYKTFYPNSVGFDVADGEHVDLVGDAHDLSAFDDDSFDVILCTEVLEHLHDPHVAISEMHRVLKPQGKLILTTRFVFPLHDVPHDYFRYTEYGLKHLLKEFKNVEVIEEANTIESLAILHQRIGLQAQTLWLTPLRILWLIHARILWWFDWILTKEYGKVGARQPVDQMFTSGYYVTCRK